MGLAEVGLLTLVLNGCTRHEQIISEILEFGLGAGGRPARDPHVLDVLAKS